MVEIGHTYATRGREKPEARSHVSLRPLFFLCGAMATTVVPWRPLFFLCGAMATTVPAGGVSLPDLAYLVECCFACCFHCFPCFVLQPLMSADYKC